MPDPTAAALARLRAGDADGALALLTAAPDAPAGGARQAVLGMIQLARAALPEALAALRAAAGLGETSPNTVLNLALAEHRAGDPARAAALIAELRRLLPGWDEPVLRQAEILRHRPDRAGAIAAYEQVLELNPRRPEALLSLAALRMEAGDPARAQMLLLRCCAVTPEDPATWDALGVALMLTGDPADAESAFAQAQRLAPQDALLALHRVEAAVAAGSGEAELARLEAAGAEDPLNPAPLIARGALLMHLARAPEAVEILQAAIALAPDSQPALLALAHAMVAASRVADAIPVLRGAVARSPDDAGLRNNLAATLLRAQRHREAADELESILAAHGESLGVLCNLTNAQVSLGLQAQGLATARRALALDPASPLAWRALCNALAYHESVTAAAMLDAAAHLGAALPRQPGAMPGPRDRSATRRLRVGLLSATLKTHPVGWLTIAGFENLDPAQFEIVCLGQPLSDDPIQRRFRAIAADWQVVDGDPPERLVGRLRALDLDILVDLGGHGDRGMMAACASRVAPVQVKWVGAQNHSTGVAEMDWFLTDRWETPPELAATYSERLLMLPDGYVCYSPPAYAPEVAELPALATGAITFGCFNNLAKLTPAVLACWSRILHSLPTARLVLKAHQLADPATRGRLLAHFAGTGIDPARLELRAGSPHRSLLAQYNDIDIVLDPFPYSGGLTTCEALWMGVPTITTPGETFSARHSMSHLSNVGLADWVAPSIDAYIDQATSRAADIPALATLRASLRARMKASPLCDAPRFGRQLGEALRFAWREAVKEESSSS